jgi:hypothetical protein
MLDVLLTSKILLYLVVSFSPPSNTLQIKDGASCKNPRRVLIADSTSCDVRHKIHQNLSE